jgi:hypothetical protein
LLNLNKKQFIDGIVDINKELQWMDPSNRGFLSLDFINDSVSATFHFIEKLDTISTKLKSSQSFKIKREGLKLKKLI